MIVEDTPRPSVLIVGRLVKGATGESRRVVHVFGLEAASATSEVVGTRCGEAFPRADVEWLTPGVGMPCESCLGLTGGVTAGSLREELGV